MTENKLELGAAAKALMGNLPEAPPDEGITLKEFLETIPPGRAVRISRMTHRAVPGGRLDLNVPDIDLRCDSDKCGGIRSYRIRTSPSPIMAPNLSNQFINFMCRNCEISVKMFSVLVKPDASGYGGTMTKYGEIPAFGPTIPSKVIALVGEDRDNFLKGRRAENQGLGIGAFAYYRRVTEKQKARIIGEVIRVAKRVGASSDQIADLERAAKEVQFSKAIDAIKHGIPESLLIDGHNPLTLLHDALSEGLHAQSDEECLGLATAIRAVLTGLVERVTMALSEERELSTAVTTLLANKARRFASKAAVVVTAPAPMHDPRPAGDITDSPPEG